MKTIIEGFQEAVGLIVSGDAQTYQVIILSLIVSVSAAFISSIIGVPLGLALGVHDFRGKKIVVRLVYTLMSIPPVIVGLLVYLFLSRKGPLGWMGLIYTPSAMIMAQVLLTLPIITGQVFFAAHNHALEILAIGKTLGAGKFQRLRLLIHELQPNILAALVSAYARAVSEVGAVMIVGGNIAGKTRVMTTSIAMLQSMGEYAQAIALGIVLLAISFIIQSILFHFQVDFRNQNNSEWSIV